MSVKVPKESVEYQSQRRCQCDFCFSRRSVNAKKMAASQCASLTQSAKHQSSGCGYDCHGAANTAASNASRGGAAGAKGMPNGSTANMDARMSKEAQDAEVMADLERLERLLILEHKARVRAALEADRIGTLRSGAATCGPQPLPEGYTPPGAELSGSRSGTGGGAGGEAVTIRDAYRMAHECPVTPPVQCRAAHRLQDTMHDLQTVTMDPINPAGRDRLQEVLYANGLAATPPAAAAGPQQKGSQLGTTAGGQYGTEFGSSLAKNRTSHPRPQGAGVVWVNRGLASAAPEAAATAAM